MNSENIENEELRKREEKIKQLLLQLLEHQENVEITIIRDKKNEKNVTKC